MSIEPIKGKSSDSKGRTQGSQTQNSNDTELSDALSGQNAIKEAVEQLVKSGDLKGRTIPLISDETLDSGDIEKGYRDIYDKVPLVRKILDKDNKGFVTVEDLGALGEKFKKADIKIDFRGNTDENDYPVADGKLDDIELGTILADAATINYNNEGSFPICTDISDKTLYGESEGMENGFFGKRFEEGAESTLGEGYTRKEIHSLRAAHIINLVYPEPEIDSDNYDSEPNE